MSRSGRSRSPPRRAASGTPPVNAVRAGDPAKLADAVGELTSRLDALELRATTTTASTSDPGARLEAVERHLELITASWGRSRPDDGERQDAARALESGVAQVADQLRRGEARAELNALQTRERLWELRRRVDRLETSAASTRAEPASSSTISEPALARLAKRLDAVEQGSTAMSPPSDADGELRELLRRFDEGQQHTLATLAALGEALAGVEQLVRLASGAAPPPSAAGPDDGHLQPSPCAAADSPPDDPAAPTNVVSLDAIEAAIRGLAEQMSVAEQRSSRTVSLMGQEVVRVAQHLDGRVEEVERRSDTRALKLGAELARMSSTVEARLEQADHAQLGALRAIDGQIATISNQLMDRIAASERASAATVAGGLAGVTAQLQRTSDNLQQRIEADMQNYASRLRDNETLLDRLSSEAGSQTEAADVQTLVLGEGQREVPFAATASTSPPPVHSARVTPPSPRQAEPTSTRAPQGAAPAASSIAEVRAAAFEHFGAAELAALSEPGSPPSQGGGGPVVALQAVVGPPPHASSNRQLIDAARLAARQASEGSSRGVRVAATPLGDPLAETAALGPKALRAGLNLLRERARMR